MIFFDLPAAVVPMFPLALRIAFVTAGSIAALPDATYAQAPQECVDASAATRERRTEGNQETMVLRGAPVEIRCPALQLFAEEIEWNRATNKVVARGNVVLQQPGTRIFARQAELDVKTGTGVFENASAVVRLAEGQVDQTMFGALDPDAHFDAERIEKIGPRKYRLTNGSFTTCVQPTPRWRTTFSSVTVTLDEHAILRNAVLRVKDVPILYLPAFYYPMQSDGRATGILMPTYGTSTIRGFSLSNAFFWALGRSHDATFYHDWFAKAGQGAGAAYRYVASPGSQGNMRVYVLRQNLKGTGGSVTSSQRSFEIKADMAQALPAGLRFSTRVDYFSDASTQQLYQQNLSDYSRRQRAFSGNLVGSWGRYRASVQAEVSDIFYGVDSAARYGHAPKFEFSIGEKPIWRTPVTFGVNSQAAVIIRREDASRPETDRGLKRMHLDAALRMPLSPWPFLTAIASANWTATYWSEHRDPATGAQVTGPLTRQLFDLRATLTGPVVARVWQTPRSGYADGFKHLIEPSVSVQRVTSFDRFDEILQRESIDTIYAGLTRLNYRLSNRLLARRRIGDSTAIREVLLLEVAQTYYTDALAASYDVQYQSSFNSSYAYTPPPSKFSPVIAQLVARPADAMTGQFRVEYDAQIGAVRTLAGSATVTTRVLDGHVSWSRRPFVPGSTGSVEHSLGGRVGGRWFEGRLSLNVGTNYELHLGKFLLSRIGANYNAQCCGFAFDLQTVNLSHIGLRSDRRFNFSFTLAGLGSFSNPLGSFGDTGGRR